jgi:hypothetical protein
MFESGESSNEDDDDNAVDTTGKGDKTLPKKYAFLAKPHDEKTPEQRRWKWVLYKCLPDDMKPFFKNPNQQATKDKKQQK